MLSSTGTVFLVDVDNTLLDNDRFGEDLGDRLERSFGRLQRERYWQIFSSRRAETGIADYLGSLQLFRDGLDGDPRLLEMSAYLLEYPFGTLVYPGALEAIAHASKIGIVVVLSDGDIVFQPHKIKRAGIWDAVDARVLIFPHKEQALDRIQERYPARRYVTVDDKPALLAAMKRILGARLTTVFVRQGHYALAAQSNASPPPDRVIERIGDLTSLNASDLQVLS